MIDLHCHLLPGCDDGARDMSVSVEMARMAVADGVTTVACTPHITPGLYNNNTEGIIQGVARLRDFLEDADIPLKLVVGADIHIDPDLLANLKEGVAPTINGTRYFLFEPPHHILPPHFVKFCQSLLDDGYAPILTHPERLTWIRSHYDVIEALNDAGVLLQVTAGSLTGAFGRTARFYSEKLLLEGRVDLVASDGHNAAGRPPTLSAAYGEVERRLGTVQAEELFTTTPARILNDELVVPKAAKSHMVVKKHGHESGWITSILGRWGRKRQTADHVELN